MSNLTSHQPDAHSDETATTSVTDVLPDASSPATFDTAADTETAQSVDDGSWGLDVTVANHTAKFGTAESLVLWFVARAGELQSGAANTVDAAAEALSREIAQRAAGGETAPLVMLGELCTVRVAAAAAELGPEKMFTRTWEQLAKGAPEMLTEALPAYLALLEEVSDGTATGSVNLGLRPTVLCAIAVWAALLADPSAVGWPALLAATGSNDDGSITSLDGEISLKLAL